MIKATVGKDVDSKIQLQGTGAEIMNDLCNIVIHTCKVVSEKQGVPAELLIMSLVTSLSEDE